jgi:hypothetical protein
MTVGSNRHHVRRSPHDRIAEAIALAVPRHRSVGACAAEWFRSGWLSPGQPRECLPTRKRDCLSRRLLDEVTTMQILLSVASPEGDASAHMTLPPLCSRPPQPALINATRGPR